MSFQQKLLSLICIALGTAFAGCNSRSSTSEVQTSPSPQSTASPNQTQLELDLQQKLTAICNRAGGTVAVALIHTETGRTSGVNEHAPLPLYSVFKLPLAVAVLKDVEANQLKLDQVVHVTPADVVPGAPYNTALWREPVDRTVAQLIEVSIAKSDNTSTDKLLQLVGGPARVTEQMRTLGFHTLNIHSSVMDYARGRRNPNTGAAADLANLLSQLQQGKLLQPSHTQLLIDYMRGATTGLRRLRGDLPAGTVVADKTGSGERNPQTNIIKAVNDVGIIALPNGRGNLAMAVFVIDSSLADEAQEKLIAELARAAYDAYAVANK